MSRKHNDANVLCLPAMLVNDPLITRIIESWLSTEFEGGRHIQRVEKMMEAPPSDPAFYEFIAGTIDRNGGAKRLPDLWELLVNYFQEQKQYELLLDLARFALKYVKEASNMHPAVLEAYKIVYKDYPNLDHYLRKSHLRDKFHLSDCLAKCDEYIYFDEGEYFKHINCHT